MSAITSHDNLYGDTPPTKWVLRFHLEAEKAFDKAYPDFTLQQVRKILAETTVSVYVQKFNEMHHKLIVPMNNGQMEFVCTWDSKDDSYRAKFNQQVKTTFNPTLSLPTETDTFWKEENVELHIQEGRLRGYDADKVLEIYDTVKKMSIPERIAQEEQIKVWGQWIEAQALIIKDLQQPFNVFRIDTKNANVGTIRVYLKSEQPHSLPFDELKRKLNWEDFMLERALKDEAGVETGKMEKIKIGKLMARESTPEYLVLELPKEEREKIIATIASFSSKDFLRVDLGGDMAKIGWLKAAMKKVQNPTDNFNGKAVNGNLRDFIFDSSKALPIFKDIQKGSEAWDKVSKKKLLKLNENQQKAVLVALHSKDLALLQGPPGTGKTTVIAEMCWQHILDNPKCRILLTSETNLAVDNAIDRLTNQKGNRYITLIKPLRFGKTQKMDEEGQRYSRERIEKWAGSNYKDEYENVKIEGEEDEVYEDRGKAQNYLPNAVQDWMIRIAERAEITTAKNEDCQNILKNWQKGLAQPNNEMKITFKNAYFRHVNIIGSTCSSVGSPAFGEDYQSIYNQKADKKEGDYKYYSRKCIEISNYPQTNTGKDIVSRLSEISFDVVIVDEASKATPPELLLPLCFGKKCVIIGDHRQLPPMIDEREFRDVLRSLKNEEADKLAEEIDANFVETSQFERLIMNKNAQSISARFTEQYRMHSHINAAIKQFYKQDEGLSPAAEIQLHEDDTNLKNSFSRHHGIEIEGFITQNTHIVWVDVKGVEKKDGTSTVNEMETKMVKKVVEMLNQSEGYKQFAQHCDTLAKDKQAAAKEIGVISFYGKQVARLKNELKSLKNLRINSVDRFQGMERNIVVVSTVRSGKKEENNKTMPNEVFGFAKKPERLNVALSRAQRLLIIVGDLDFFERNKLYRNVIREIRNNGKIIDAKTLN